MEQFPLPYFPQSCAAISLHIPIADSSLRAILILDDFYNQVHTQATQGFYQLTDWKGLLHMIRSISVFIHNAGSYIVRFSVVINTSSTANTYRAVFFLFASFKMAGCYVQRISILSSGPTSSGETRNADKKDQTACSAGSLAVLRTSSSTE